MSPLLANIVLHDLDMELEKRGHQFVRYADELTQSPPGSYAPAGLSQGDSLSRAAPGPRRMVLVKSERAGQRVMASLMRFLEKKLRLAVNPAKSKVAPLNQCRFLGFTFRRKKIVWSDKSLAQFKWRVKELTGRSWGVSMEYRIKKLSEYLRGWMAYFALSEYYKPVPELDEWISRRLSRSRSASGCYWSRSEAETGHPASGWQ